MSPTVFRSTTFSSLWIAVALLSGPQKNTPVFLSAGFVWRQALRAIFAETGASQVIRGKTKTHEGPLNCVRTLLAELQVVLRSSPIIAVAFNHDDQAREIAKHLLEPRSDVREVIKRRCAKSVLIQIKVQVRGHPLQPIGDPRGCRLRLVGRDEGGGRTARPHSQARTARQRNPEESTKNQAAESRHEVSQSTHLNC